MQVEISVALADPGNPLTYSGYAATAKVADGVLGQRSWPMRQLADLQGDGFPLDGSRELYETKTASQANGKLGVRGHVGQDADVTISRSRTIPSVEVRASGASAVVYGGTAYSLETGSANVLIGATSATLTFVPKDATVRAEVSYIGSTTEFVIRNDTLIRAVVSLRSDLSLYGQTLPESELNVEAFIATDVSEYVAGVAEDTPITYRAGYDDEMSAERRFYVTGQVSWANNVLSIHAVDAVHFLEYELPTSVQCRDYTAVRDVFLAYANALVPDLAMETLLSGVGTSHAKLEKGKTIRDYAAFLNWAFHQDPSIGLSLWPTYVDAGIPSFSESLPQADLEIFEEDCEEPKRIYDHSIRRITVNTYEVDDSSYFDIVGNATLVKNVGATLKIDTEAEGIAVGLAPVAKNGNGNMEKLISYFGPGSYGLPYGVMKLIPMTTDGGRANESVVVMIRPPDGVSGSAGQKMFGNDIPQEDFRDYPTPDATRTVYSRFIPWGCYYDTSEWAGVYPKSTAALWTALTNAGIISGENEVSFDIGGRVRTISAVSKTYSAADAIGEAIEITEDWFKGPLKLGTKVIFPDAAYRSVLKRSTLTGSFTWKGDPRMQPRDVVTFHRLDGTDEVITLENITITHEGGGTSAEITYRKGIV